MGKLAFWGAVGGLGQGIVKQAEMKHETKLDESRTAREVQLQRMRDKSAMERQQEADREAAARQEREWGEDGYRAQFEQLQSGLQSEEQRRREAHDIVIEGMRQREETRRAQMRLSENQSEFEWDVVEEKSVTDPFTQQTTHTPRSVTVRDGGGEYRQVGVQNVGTIFVPSDFDPPPADKVRQGRELTGWLLNAPAGDREERMNRKYQFLRLFGYLPPEYFEHYDPRAQQYMQQRSSETEIRPASQQ